jgi:hypothetical protein
MTKIYTFTSHFPHTTSRSSPTPPTFILPQKRKKHLFFNYLSEVPSDCKHGVTNRKLLAYYYFYPRNPVYARRLDPSVLGFSLSLYRHPSICILFTSHFTMWPLTINKKSNQGVRESESPYSNDKGTQDSTRISPCRMGEKGHRVGLTVITDLLSEEQREKYSLKDDNRPCPTYPMFLVQK